MRFEKIEKKFLFKIFREKMDNYISTIIKYGNKVVGILETYKGIQSTYGTNRMPKYLSIED